MKNIYLKYSFFLFLLLMTSCSKYSESIVLGEYEVMGIQLTKSGRDDIQINSIYSSLPVMTFMDEDKVKIRPDFSFGYFEDSLFVYKVKNGYLHLKGENSELKIMYEPYIENERVLYKLYLNSNYINVIDIVRVIDKNIHLPKK